MTPMSDQVRPFTVDISAAAIADLRERLGRTRWPNPEPVEDWTQGIPLAYTKELCHYWRTEYDFGAARSRLNAFPHFTTEIDGLTSTSCTPARRTPTRCRWSSRTAGPARSSSSSTSSRR